MTFHSARRALPFGEAADCSGRTPDAADPERTKKIKGKEKYSARVAKLVAPQKLLNAVVRLCGKFTLNFTAHR